ncbi:MAG: serpin family protein [bacterium]|nr:serpin family protein [bacterium]
MKKLISIMLAAAICPTAAMAEDTPSEWARKSVERALNIGILSYDYEFKPQKAITREDFCTLAFQTINNAPIIVDFKEYEGEPKFSDTDNKKIAALCEAGIIDGRSDGLFAPKETLTREEAAVILARMSKYLGIEASENKCDEYSDGTEISNWARESVKEISKAGIMNGVGDNLFLPGGEYTEEQSVVTLIRFYDLILMPENETGYFADRLNEQMPDNRNYVFSPFSIKTVLALAANGAEGETKKEILEAVGIDDLDTFNEKTKEMIESFSDNEILQFCNANAIWVNSDKTSQKFSKEYREKIGDFYGGEARSVTDENAVKEINGWISEKTNGKISDVISDSEFWAMLVNAVYFRGIWYDEFYEGNTKKAEFTDRNGKKSEIDFMNKLSWLDMADIDGTKMLSLPYRNTYDIFDENGNFLEMKYTRENINMYIILNDSTNEDIEQILSEAIRKNMFTSEYVQLSLPKFKVEYNTDLTDILRRLGISKAFETENAQFEPMFDKGRMFITDVAHSGYISVDEKGTEAAAVTTAGMAGNSLPPEPVEFKADRPFTFVIRDNTRDEILFMGEFAYAE